MLAHHLLGYIPLPVIDSSSLILLVACRATLSKNAKLMLVLVLLHKEVYVTMAVEYKKCGLAANHFSNDSALVGL